MSKNAYIFTALIAVLEVLALVFNLTDGMRQMESEASFFSKFVDELWATLLYFTVLTNGLVGIIFAYQAFHRRFWSPAWLGALTVWMVVLALVYHILLAQPFDGFTIGYASNLLYHTLCPLLVAVWWVVYAPKSGLQWSLAFIWLAWPMGYLVYALVRGLMGGVFPYFFLDVHELGVSGLLTWVAILVAVFTIANFILLFVARLFRSSKTL